MYKRIVSFLLALLCVVALCSPALAMRLPNRFLRDDDLDFNRYQGDYYKCARSKTSGEAWVALETAIEILFERAVIAPCLSPNVTDGRFYSGLKGKVYRFSPFVLGSEEALRGECTVDDDALQTAVQFFRQMLSV